MGVKFGKEYEVIVSDLTEALIQIDDCREFIGMEEQDWNRLTDEEKSSCLRTLADDIFFALGADPVMEIGNSTFTYHPKQHIIKIEQGATLIHVIRLI